MPDGALNVTGEPTLARLALSNLISNANRQSPRVTVIGPSAVLLSPLLWSISIAMSHSVSRDIVEGLDPISVAMGHDAIAATNAHDWLHECDCEAI